MSQSTLAARPVPGVSTTELRGAARGGLANMVGAAVAGTAGFAVTWLVARGLGRDEAGGFFAGTAAFVMVGMLAKLGTQTSLVYFLARLRTRNASVDAIRRCLRAGLVPVAVAAVLTGVLMAVLAPELARLTTRGRVHPGYVTQLRVLAIFLPLGVLSDTLLAATRGFRTMRPTVVLDKVLRPGLQVLGLATLTLASSRMAGAYTAAWVAPYLLSALLAAVALRQRVPREERVDEQPGDDGVDGRTFWRFTGPRAVASVAQLALNRFDVLLLAALAGLPAAAVYAVAGRFIVLGQFANQAINQSVQPRIAERLAVGDMAGANELYQSATAWLVLAAWPLYFGVAVFAKVYLGMFGEAYESASTVVVILAGAMLVATGCGMVDIVLAMAGRTTWNLANVITALGVNIAVDLVLIPHIGALGAAIGLACALVANNVVPLLQISLVLGLHPFGRGTLVAAALATGCYGIVPLLLAAVLGVHPLTAVLGAALGTALYVVAVTRLRGVLNMAAFFAARRTERGRTGAGRARAGQANTGHGEHRAGCRGAGGGTTADSAARDRDFRRSSGSGRGTGSPTAGGGGDHHPTTGGRGTCRPADGGNGFGGGTRCGLTTAKFSRTRRRYRSTPPSSTRRARTRRRSVAGSGRTCGGWYTGSTGSADRCSTTSAAVPAAPSGCCPAWYGRRTGTTRRRPCWSRHRRPGSPRTGTRRRRTGRSRRRPPVVDPPSSRCSGYCSTRRRPPGNGPSSSPPGHCRYPTRGCWLSRTTATPARCGTCRGAGARATRGSTNWGTGRWSGC